MFKVLYQTSENATKYGYSLHTAERKARHDTVKAIGGKAIASYVVDTDHQDGLEIHTVLDSGIVVIGNYRKQVIITWLIARPAQLQRYGITDSKILEVARQHQEQGLNQI